VITAPVKSGFLGHLLPGWSWQYVVMTLIS